MKIRPPSARKEIELPNICWYVFCCLRFWLSQKDSSDYDNHFIHSQRKKEKGMRLDLILQCVSYLQCNTDNTHVYWIILIHLQFNQLQHDCSSSEFPCILWIVYWPVICLLRCVCLFALKQFLILNKKSHVQGNIFNLLYVYATSCGTHLILLLRSRV